MLVNLIKGNKNILEEFIFPILPLQIATMIRKIPISVLHEVTEIRLRVNRPLLLVLGTKDMMVRSCDAIGNYGNSVYLCTRDDVNTTLQLISKNSLYAFEQDIKKGFITIMGGHRVGLAGQAISEEGQIKTLKNISSLNIRIAREIIGCADMIMPYIFTHEKHIVSTLVISPPRCGKTTLLRDLVRQISTGNKEQPGVQVGLVDERSEIAACRNGIPTVDLGMRTDVMDSCPKASGMLMLIRSMSPTVVATDELGRAEDVEAVQEALHAGVRVLATVHGRNMDEVLKRPFIGALIQQNFFERYVILSDKPTVGTVVQIIDGKQNKILWEKG